VGLYKRGKAGQWILTCIDLYMVSSMLHRNVIATAPESTACAECISLTHCLALPKPIFDQQVDYPIPEAGFLPQMLPIKLVCMLFCVNKRVFACLCTVCVWSVRARARCVDCVVFVLVHVLCVSACAAPPSSPQHLPPQCTPTHPIS
jgi:hypothetical protein